MMTPAAAERRQHPRHPGNLSYLQLDGRPARLIDWSFGGIGVKVEDGADMPAVEQNVEIRIFAREAGEWRTVKGRVQRADATERAVGVVFTDEGQSSVRLLIDLLGFRLGESSLAL